MLEAPLRRRAEVLDAPVSSEHSVGRPEPFQVAASRFGARTAREVPLSTLFFDVLHAVGADLLEEALTRRAEALDALVAPEHHVGRTVTEDPAAAQAAFDAALAAG